ncbi:MAG: SWF/SNF helicase family protein [Chloroflexi bacterium]|nr:SWF/SNF helicase family protein [Chloroflexota bacterium]
MKTVRTGVSEVRIGSAAKGQRHETRLEELALIAQDVRIDASNFTSPYDTPIIFDGSCAHGKAVAYLAEQWECIPWGNEIERKGYEGAALILDQATHGPQESLEVEGYFDIFFNNPPYDMGANLRLEIEHVEQNIGWLRAQGIGIAVLPQAILNNELFWEKWHEWMSDTQVRKYPEPEFSKFKQFVVYGRKRHNAAGYYDTLRDVAKYTGRDWEDADVLGVRRVDMVLNDLKGYYYSRNYPKVTEIRNSLPQGGQIVEDLTQMPSIFDVPEWEMITRPPMDPQRSNPAMPLGAGHIVQVGAAGMFHGQEMEIDGQPYMVTGSSYKWVHKYSVTDGDKTVTHHVEKPAYKISALGLEDGHFMCLDSHKGQKEYAAFLKKTTGPLIEAVTKSYPPHYQMDYAPWVDRFNEVHGPRVLPGREANGLLTAQKHVAAAILKVFERHKAAILVGEMGVGKTLDSIATMAIESAGGSLTDKGQNWRVVVLAPAVVAPKWVEEAGTILRDIPGFKAFMIGREVKQPHQVPHRPGSTKKGLARMRNAPLGVTPGKARGKKIRKPITDTQNAMAHDGPAMLVIPYEVAKFGSPWEHVAIRKRQLVKWTETVPHFNRHGEEDGTEDEEHEKIVDVFHCPDCYEMLRRENPDGSAGRPWTMGKAKDDDFCTKTAYAVKRRCPDCGGILYQDIPFKKGGRFPVAEYLSQNYGGQYSLIIDELHNLKGGQTAIGMASQDAISGATKVIAMTGTIFNGYARSLFHLMYRLNPQFRKLYKHDDATKFAQQHGYADTVVTKTKRRSSASGYSGDFETTRVDEAPGASPEMVAMLMPNTVFLTLADIGVDLPPYQEIAVPVEMRPSLRKGYNRIKSHESEVKYQFSLGNKGPLAAWTQAMLGWLDCAKADTNEKGKEDDRFSAPTIRLKDGDVLPKDEALLNLVKENLNEGRGTAVFFEQVNRRPAMGRVQKVLEKEGIHAFILTQKIKGEERMPWIREQIEVARSKGQEPVLLANGSLIKEGVDLLEFPTICEFGQHYNINTLRQRLRRSWRLGQTKDVRIYFLYYKDTKQEEALIHIANKLRAAHQVDGNVAAGIAAFEMGKNEFIQTLMSEAKGIAGGKLAKLMQTKVVTDVSLRLRAPERPKAAPAPEPQFKKVTIVPTRASQEVAQQLSFF